MQYLFSGRVNEDLSFDVVLYPEQTFQVFLFECVKRVREQVGRSANQGARQRRVSAPLCRLSRPRFTKGGCCRSTFVCVESDSAAQLRRHAIREASFVREQSCFSSLDTHKQGPQAGYGVNEKQ